jgi:hypothetical protein
LFIVARLLELYSSERLELYGSEPPELYSSERQNVFLAPEFSEIFREQMFDIFDLALADVPCQHFENGTGHSLGIDPVVIAEGASNVI